MKKRVPQKLPKKMTLERLAGLVVEGFADVDRRFDLVDKRFDEIDARFDTLEEKLEELDRRVAAPEMKVSGIERRLDEEAMERVDVKALFTRLSKLEEAVFGKK